jgi:hypothetical protein
MTILVNARVLLSDACRASLVAFHAQQTKTIRAVMHSDLQVLDPALTPPASCATTTTWV